jgi:hypothetical protein
MKKLRRDLLPGTLYRRKRSIISGVGGRKTMLEKLFLAITITFSLNLFLQVHVPEQTNINNYQQEAESSPNLVVRLPRKLKFYETEVMNR